MMKKIFEVQKPIIGMIHLKPLPGSPNYDKNKFDMNAIVKYAVEEAKILEQAGVNGLQIENYWDIPFVKGEEIGYETCAAMTAAACAVKNSVNIPIGINVHMNGGKAAMAIACASGAKWIRVFEFCKCLCILYRINRRNWWRIGQIQKNVGCKRYTVAL